MTCAAPGEMHKVESCVFGGSGLTGKSAGFAASASAQVSTGEARTGTEATCGLISSHFTLAFAQAVQACVTRLAEGPELKRLRLFRLPS